VVWPQKRTQSLFIPTQTSFGALIVRVTEGRADLEKRQIATNGMIDW
jgi:hypothetical protein